MRWARAGRPDLLTFFALPDEQQEHLAAACDEVYAAREAAKVTLPAEAVVAAGAEADEEKRLEQAMLAAAEKISHG